MTDYQFPTGIPDFPTIRWERLEDGRYAAEWLVEFVPQAALPLLARPATKTQVQVSFPSDHQMLVRLVSEDKPMRPDVYSVFYQLIRPSFDAGFILAIEGGDLEDHEYIVKGTSDEPKGTQ